MNANPCFALLVAVGWLTPAALPADCAIAGVVKLPAAVSVAGLKPATGVRYKGVAPNAVAAPAPRVAIVYLEGDFGAAASLSSPAAAQVEQKQFQFVPALLPIQKGTRVAFPNRDEEYHNILSYSRAKEFDLGRYLKNEQPPAVVFEKTGVVELNCEIHEHMRAYIVVLDTPYFTTTDSEGKFRLEHLPAGKHTLKAWLNPKTVWQQPVELTADVPLQVNLAAP